MIPRLAILFFFIFLILTRKYTHIPNFKKKTKLLITPIKVLEKKRFSNPTFFEKNKKEKGLRKYPF